MAEISLCMIVKNEEKNLKYCLNSIAGAVDEINIVDTGSRDKTIEIAKQYTNRVFYFTWIDDFAAARNFSYSKATKDFIMWLDADDIITQENFDTLLQLKTQLNDKIDFVITLYRTHYNEDGRPSMIFPKIRITRKSAGLSWKWAIHEDLQPSGKGIFANLYIDHKYKNFTPSSKRNTRILRKEIDEGRGDYRIHYYYGLTCFQHGNFDEAERYLDMVMESGMVESFDSLDVFIMLHNIYKIRGDIDKARDILEDNESKLSDKSEFYCGLGEFYRDTLYDPVKACEIFKKALKCNGTFRRKDIPGQRNPDFYYHIPCVLLGKTYLNLRDSESALMYYESALAYRKDIEIERITRKLMRIIILQKSLDIVNV